jgi:hypothetical protein
MLCVSVLGLLGTQGTLGGCVHTRSGHSEKGRSTQLDCLEGPSTVAVLRSAFTYAQAERRRSGECVGARFDGSQGDEVSEWDVLEAFGVRVIEHDFDGPVLLVDEASVVLIPTRLTPCERDEASRQVLGLLAQPVAS